MSSHSTDTVPERIRIAEIVINGARVDIPVRAKTVGMYKRLGENERDLKAKTDKSQELLTEYFAISNIVYDRLKKKTDQYESGISKDVLDTFAENIKEFMTSDEYDYSIKISNELQELEFAILELYWKRFEILVAEPEKHQELFESIPFYANDHSEMRAMFMKLEGASSMNPDALKKNMIRMQRG